MSETKVHHNVESVPPRYKGRKLIWCVVYNPTMFEKRSRWFETKRAAMRERDERIEAGHFDHWGVRVYWMPDDNDTMRGMDGSLIGHRRA